MKMRILLALLLGINAPIVFAQIATKKEVTSAVASQKKQKISGQVMQVFNYCGGAAPSQEILDEMLKPKPYSGKTFYIRKGKTNSLKRPVILTFKANADGTFSFELPAGVYSIIQELQVKPIVAKEYNQTGFLVTDLSCLKKWWVKPYFVLEVKDKEVTQLNFQFNQRCFIPADLPCTEYTGPLPQ